MKKLHASCLCKAVIIELDDDFEYAGFCHCHECQKLSGSAFAAFGGIRKGKVRIRQGEAEIRFFYKTEKSRVAFCGNCSCTLFTEKTDRDITNLRLGILDEIATKRPDFHIYMASAAPWHETSDALPKFDTLPD